MSLPTKVEIVEVGTRDGLQNEKKYISPEDKIKLLDTITDAGVRRIEVTSFVSPRHVPQLKDAAEVLAGCKRSPDAEYEALVPNVRGMERAPRVRTRRRHAFRRRQRDVQLKEHPREPGDDARRRPRSRQDGAGCGPQAQGRRGRHLRLPV